LATAVDDARVKAPVVVSTEYIFNVSGAIVLPTAAKSFPLMTGEKVITWGVFDVGTVDPTGVKAPVLVFT